MRNDWKPIWNAETGWQVNFSIEGERIRRRLGIHDKSLKNLANRKAKALYREIWDRHLNPITTKPGTLFYLAAKGYLDAGGEARFLPPLLKHFGPDLIIEDIDEALIITTGHELYPNRSPDTHRRQVRVPMSAVARWASGKRRRPSTDNRRLRWLTPEEAQALLDAAAKLALPRHNAPEPFTLTKIAFLLGSGCRTGECFAAEVKDWNVATSQLWIPAIEIGAGKTNSSARWVRPPDKAVALMGDLPDVGRMFRTPYGLPIKMRKSGGGQMQAAFNKARDHAGLGPEVTPHVLRHTWATWFYAQTKDIAALKDLGGWSNYNMVDRYRKLAPADLPARLLKYGWDFGQEFGNSELDKIIPVILQQDKSI